MGLGSRGKIRFFTATILWNHREDREHQHKGSYPFEEMKDISISHL